jgi:hypothetical protein
MTETMLPRLAQIGRDGEKRWWKGATETPVLVDAYAWTDERHIFAVLVWPALEPPSRPAAHAPRERARQVIRVLHAGAAERAWSTRYEVDHGIRWDPAREAWVAADGFAYDGQRLYDYCARQGEGGR